MVKLNTNHPQTFAWFLGPTLVVLWLCLESRLFLRQPSLGFVCFHK